MKIQAVIWQEDDVWCGSVPALPGCHTWGDSQEHLVEMLEEAVQGWLDVSADSARLSDDVENSQQKKQLIELSL
jgi:predicted RNase H-like HicB family nuclease